MMQPYFDIAIVADLRFPGGTSGGIAEEIQAHAAAGYRTALVHVKGPVLKYPHPFHPRIRACIDAGLAELVDPDLPISAGLLLIHHPMVFNHLPARALSIEAERRLLIVQHPPLDAAGTPQYDWGAIDLHARETVGGAVVWAPISPLVRTHFAGIDDGLELLPEDWYHVIDTKRWRAPREGFVAARPVIGRHSRPDALKWPDDRETILAAYPDDPRFVVHVLGGGPYLKHLIGFYPANWRVWPFNAVPVDQFLWGIDFFVYFHHSRWVEAFGRTIIEALASGAIGVLQPSFRTLIGDAALYAEPAQVPELVAGLHRDPDACRRQRGRSEAVLHDRFSHAAHVRRLRKLIGRPRPTSVPMPAMPVRRRKRVMFLTSNGVGMGHLTRLLAIARRCPAPIQPVFVTMSQAMHVIREQGFLAEYLPFHAYLGCDISRWNRYLHQTLNELIALYEPAVVVFDGNMPYGGLGAATEENRECWFVWCRRGMWRSNANIDHVKREIYFDAVIEPRDLACALDVGPTVHYRSRTRVVAPIRLLEDHEMLSREAARRELNLEAAQPAALVQLGSGNNFDMTAVHKRVVAHLISRDIQVVVVEWLIANQAPELPAGVRRLQYYPVSRYLNAFDLAVSAVGYNSFHEVLLAGIPTLFVPNENPMMDDQLTRARYAERHGLALCVRTSDTYRLLPSLNRLLDSAERERLRLRCAALNGANGAEEAARAIEEMVYSRRADRGRR